MNRCDYYYKSIPEYLYGEMQGEDREGFEQHLKKCGSCNRELSEMRELFETIDLRPDRKELDEAFWERNWRKFESNLSAESNLLRSSRQHFLSRNPLLKIAAAFILVVLGFLLGRSGLWRGEDTPGDIYLSDEAAFTEKQALVDYLQRSKVILLGVIRLDPQSEDLKQFDFQKEKDLSERLIHEAASLKTTLRKSGDRKTAVLVEELEIILLQIHHLDEKSTDWIDLVKDAAEKKSLLFRINLEEMRGSKESGDSSKNLNNHQL
jgi:hypothetical protein